MTEDRLDKVNLGSPIPESAAKNRVTMDKNLLNEVKNKLYEAEGLLELLQQRNDKSADLAPLIMKKIEEASAFMSKLSATPREDEPLTVVPAVSEPLPEEAEEEQPIYVSTESDDDIDADNDNDNGTETEQLPPVFCLNDRFRFRRSLFGGNNDEFNAVLKKISSFPTYEDAEEYFYSELGFDPEDEDVVDFMEIIKLYFAR